MKIAFPTNDRKTIAKRTGRCKEFAIVEITENNIIYNYRANTHQHEHHDESEEHEHSHHEIIELLAGVDLLIVNKIRKYMINDLDKSKIEYKQVKDIEINKVINTIKKEV